MTAVPGSATSLSLLDQLKQEPQDQDAWARFVAKYRPKILGWCRDRGLQEFDAEDVTQIVMTSLAEKMKDFVYDSRGSFRAWLRTVTQHACSKWALRGPREAGTGDSANVRLLGEVEAREELARKLEEVFDLELLSAALARVRERVQPQTWEAFKLTALDGLSGNEVAKRLSMPVAHVFVAKSRVQKYLREELEQGPAE